MIDFDSTTATDILAALKAEKMDIQRQKEAIPRAVNMEVLDKKKWDALHRKQLHLEKIEEYIFKVAKRS